MTKATEYKRKYKSPATNSAIKTEVTWDVPKGSHLLNKLYICGITEPVQIVCMINCPD